MILILLLSTFLFPTYDIVAQNLNKDHLITYKTSSCYGDCPVFELSIYNNGIIIYHGIANVDSIGYYSSKVSEEIVKTLKENIKHEGFYSLKHKYPEIGLGLVDFPMFSVELNEENIKHQVYAKSDYPENLQKIKKNILDFMGELDFNKINKENTSIFSSAN